MISTLPLVTEHPSTQTSTSATEEFWSITTTETTTETTTTTTEEPELPAYLDPELQSLKASGPDTFCPRFVSGSN